MEKLSAVRRLHHLNKHCNNDTTEESYLEKNYLKRSVFFPTQNAHQDQGDPSNHLRTFFIILTQAFNTYGTWNYGAWNRGYSKCWMSKWTGHKFDESWIWVFEINQHYCIPDNLSVRNCPGFTSARFHHHLMKHALSVLVKVFCFCSASTLLCTAGYTELRKPTKSISKELCNLNTYGDMMPFTNRLF